MQVGQDVSWQQFSHQGIFLCLSVASLLELDSSQEAREGGVPFSHAQLFFRRSSWQMHPLAAFSSMTCFNSEQSPHLGRLCRHNDQSLPASDGFALLIIDGFLFVLVCGGSAGSLDFSERGELCVGDGL
jgi:hypothetical protein